MGKFLFWAVVILGALFAARLLAAHNRKNTTPPVAPPAGRGNAAMKGNDANAEPMVRCAHCGIHMPRSEAVLSDGKTWCSAEHAKLGLRSDRPEA